MSRRIPEGMTRSELFPNHKSRPRAQAYNMTLLASELEDWASFTKSVNFSEFTRPRKLTYSKIKAEAMRNPDVQEALCLVKDALADNLKKLWIDNPTMKEYVKSYLDCFDEIIQERRAQVHEMISRSVAANSPSTIIQLTDSSGYFDKKNNDVSE